MMPFNQVWLVHDCSMNTIVPSFRIQLSPLTYNMIVICVIRKQMGKKVHQSLRCLMNKLVIVAVMLYMD